jgi:carbon monoxide dehydrogenase subunit G
MDIREQSRIPSRLDQVWPLISDPTLVAACIPGAQLAPDQGDGVWRGSIKVRFGPTVAAFRGEVTLTYDHAAHRCAIEGRGIDQRGASRALSSGTIHAVAEGDETVLNVEGSFTVTGPLETFANAGGVHVARALLAEFSTNLAKLVAERGTPEAEEAPMADAMPSAPPPAPAPLPPPAPAAELNAFSLLWRVLKSWATGLFSKRKH